MSPHPGLRALAEAALGHPVPVILPVAEGRPAVAASVAGDPPHVRVAWVADDGRPIARLGCPPGRPSRPRPVVACVAEVAAADLADRLLVTRAAPGVAAVRAVLAAEGPDPEAPAGPEGIALLRLPFGVPVLAVDALDAGGEPVGRLDRAGVSELVQTGGRISGRLGQSHGMGAGIGGGGWVDDLDHAAFAAGFTPRLPAWVPPGLEQSRPRLEPDLAYPAAPPAVIVTWTGGDGARVLLRQCLAPLASPDPGGAGAREVPVGPWTAALRARGLVTLVWETDDLAFGIQVRRLPDPEEVALRVAASIPDP